MAHDHSHAHGHAHGRGLWTFPLDRQGRLLAAVVGTCLLLTVVGILAFWPTEDVEVPAQLSPGDIERVDATVLSVEQGPCSFAPEESGLECETITFEVTSGSTEGTVETFDQTLGPSALPIDEGDDLILFYNPDPALEPQFRYSFADFDRDQPLVILVVLFALAVVLLGRWQGVRSLVALGISFVVLLGFTLPALLESSSPVLVALVGSAAVAFITMYVTHGVSHLITVALIGTFASLGLTGVLAWIFVGATSLTGLSDEDAGFLLAGDSAVDLEGLLLAGIIIGALGVLDDVTITQAAAVEQIHEANPRYSTVRLFRSALRVGRDHIGSTTNTLVFAYAGAALPLLLLFTQTQLSIRTVVTSEIVAIEVVRALVGGIGLVASVPITTALAVWVVKAASPPRPDPVVFADVPLDEPPAPSPPPATVDEIFWRKD